MQRLQEALAKDKANNSASREAIYSLLLESNEVLSVSEILERSWKSSLKKIALNTLYRHLNFFSKHQLVLVLQDNLKKSYYVINNSSSPCFRICPKCNRIEKLKTSSNPCKEYGECEYIVLYQSCKECPSPQLHKRLS